jgi:hypothetical protein
LTRITRRMCNIPVKAASAFATSRWTSKYDKALIEPKRRERYATVPRQRSLASDGRGHGEAP